MASLPKIVSAAAVGAVLCLSAQAEGSLGISAGADVGGLASADLDIGLGSGSLGGIGSGLSVGLDVGLGGAGTGVGVSVGTGIGTGVGVSVGVGTGGGTGTGPATPGVGPAQDLADTGGAAVQNPALRRLLGMAVLSSDRKLVGILDGIEKDTSGYRMRIRTAEGLGTATPHFTLLTKTLQVSDVIRLQMSLRSLLDQI